MFHGWGSHTTEECEHLKKQVTNALRSKPVGLLVVLKMKITRIIFYCVHWGKADENPIDQESWKNLTCERSVRTCSLAVSVRLSG